MEESPEVPDSSQALPRVATGTNWLELAEMWFFHPLSCPQLNDGQRSASCTNPFQLHESLPASPPPQLKLWASLGTLGLQLSPEQLGVGNAAASLPDHLAKPPELRGEKAAVKSSARRDFTGMLQI